MLVAEIDSIYTYGALSTTKSPGNFALRMLRAVNPRGLQILRIDRYMTLFVQKIFAVAIWPVTGQGFQNTQ